MHHGRTPSCATSCRSCSRLKWAPQSRRRPCMSKIALAEEQSSAQFARSLRRPYLAAPIRQVTLSCGSSVQPVPYPPDAQTGERQRDQGEERGLVNLEGPIATGGLIYDDLVEFRGDVRDTGVHAAPRDRLGMPTAADAADLLNWSCKPGTCRPQERSARGVARLVNELGRKRPGVRDVRRKRRY